MKIEDVFEMMLWLDVSKNKDIKKKIKEAITYYKKKYNENPNVAFVHSQYMNGKKTLTVNKVKVFPNDTVMPNHLYLGNKNRKKAIGM